MSELPVNETQKPRAEATLRNLPEERQAEIVEFSRDHTLADTVRWLAESGVETSPAALSRFLSNSRLRLQIARNEDATRELIAQLAQQDPNLTSERLFEIGHLFFAGLAIEKQDSRSWFLTQQIVLRKAQLDLAAKKYNDQIQTRKEAIARELNAAKSSGGISPETILKIENELNLF